MFLCNRYDEIKDYDYNNHGFASNTGHFTQVIWKTSLRVGVGIARGTDRVIVCAQYSPQGNFLGQFSANVMPLK